VATEAEGGSGSQISVADACRAPAEVPGFVFSDVWIDSLSNASSNWLGRRPDLWEHSMLTKGSVCALSLAVLARMGIAGIVFAQTTNEKGSKMGVVAVQITIKSYEQWRPVFDRLKPLRDKAGSGAE
jgi:hypothetical protein